MKFNPWQLIKYYIVYEASEVQINTSIILWIGTLNVIKIGNLQVENRLKHK